MGPRSLPKVMNGTGAVRQFVSKAARLNARAAFELCAPWCTSLGSCAGEKEFQLPAGRRARDNHAPTRQLQHGFIGYPGPAPWRPAIDLLNRVTFGVYESRHVPFCEMELILRPSVVTEGDRRKQFMHKESGNIVETSVEARAGFLDRPTLVVLMVSTSVAIALFAAIYIGFFAR
jgi:hypothetical protein